MPALADRSALRSRAQTASWRAGVGVAPARSSASAAMAALKAASARDAVRAQGGGVVRIKTARLSYAEARSLEARADSLIARD